MQRGMEKWYELRVYRAGTFKLIRAKKEWESTILERSLWRKEILYERRRLAKEDK